MSIAFAGFLHIVAVVVWVGGMSFVHLALRPSLSLLEPAQRLPLMAATLGRFFTWVVLAVGVIVASGAFLVVAGPGLAGARWHIHVMSACGLAMAAIFAYVRWAAYPRLVTSVASRDWSAGAGALTLIRRLVATNLVLGLATIGVATLGRGS